MPALLAAINVSFAYDPPEPVLAGVSACIDAGTLTGIVGPNGAGKSTLLKLLAGQLLPQGGAITLDRSPLAAMRGVDRARRLAYLPQSVEPVFALTVYETVALGRYPHGGALRALGPRDHRVIARCLEQTETGELRERPFTTLSGGERQRALLASILAQEPEVLLLDEPTSSLDIHHQHEVFALLRRLAGEGYGIGIVTHDLNAAARFCTHLCLLGPEGSVLAEGAPSEVLTEAHLSRAYGPGVRVCAHPLTHLPLITMADEVIAP